MEEQIRRFPLKWYVAELIDEQQCKSIDPAHLTCKGAIALCIEQASQQPRSRSKQRAIAVAACRETDGKKAVCLAGARWPVENQRTTVTNECAVGQLEDSQLRNVWLKREVEAFERLKRWQTRLDDTALDAALMPAFKFGS